MASPHVAGAAALVMQGLPKLNPRKIETYLQNSADPKNWSGNAALGFLDYAFRQGAGMVDIVGTLETALVLEPSQISVGESESGPKTFTIDLRNLLRTPVTYDITHVPALAAGPNNVGVGTSYAPTGTFNAPATVTFSAPTVTLAARRTATFDVTIDANAGLPDRSLYGGYIVLTPQGGGAPYRIPYAGFKGDYQSTQVLTPTANGFPWLAQLLPCTPPATGLCYFNQPAGATYTLVGDDLPIFLMHLDHLSRRVRLEVFDAVTGRRWHRVSNDHYVTRNSTPGGFFTWTWDGGTFTGEGKKVTQLYTVPDGQYIVKVSVLKALGDESNPAHVETWTSPVITIDRP
jgi:hypothetical protein